MPLGVERDDLELERLALVDDVTRVGDALVGQLADVDQALEAVADAHERAEVDELGDRAVDDVADLEVRDRGVPRVGLQAADRQADATALVVDVDDLGLDLLADVVAGLGVVDLVPRELALVDEAVDAAEVDEDTERSDRADRAGDLLADLQAAEQLVALLAALFVEGDLLGQDQAVRLAVDLEDLEPELAADERHQLLGDLLGRVARLVVLRPAREVDDLADRDEAADAAVDDEATLVVVDDRRLDDDARLELLLHRAPLALEAGTAERQDDMAFRRFGLEDVDEDGVPDRQLRLTLAVATEQLAVADDALALGADVDEDLVLVDADHLALDDVTVLEALDVRVLLGEELLHGRRLGAELARSRLLLVVAGGGRVGGLVVAEGLGRSTVLGGVDDRGFGDGRGLLDRGGLRRESRRPRGSPRPLRPQGSRGLRRRHVRPAVVDPSGAASAASVVASGASALVGTASSVVMAGSSATATAAAVSSVVRSSEAIASGSDAVPLCCSSVKVVVTPGCGFAPENHERPERRSSRFRNGRGEVRGDRSAVRSFVRRMGLVSLLQLSCLLGPGESSTRLLKATIAAPCPNCPI